MSSLRPVWVAAGVAVALTTGPVVAALAADSPESPGDTAAAQTVAALPVHTVVQPPATEPVTILTSKGKGRSARGDRFVAVSATGSNDVPQAALRAYKNAADSLDTIRPGCNLPWTLLAAIGRVESDHGRYGGSVLGSDGVSRPAILGLPLNGVGPVAAIHDTDDGRLDGDKVWDRAVGPMQFIPSTWAGFASDGDGDGSKSPNDIDDAALGAGKYLCAGGFSVADSSGLARAIFSYNHSDYYVALVMAFQKGYETGVFVLPSPPPPPGAGDGMPTASGGGKKPGQRDPQPTSTQSGGSGSGGGSAATGGGGKTGGGKTGGGSGGGGSGGGGGTTTPSPTPTPTPSPTPTGPVLSSATGPLQACDGGYCVSGTKLGFGPADQLGRTAAHDYDGDGGRETNAAELDGLVASGASTRFAYELQNGVGVVYVIGDHDYRFADGTFA